MAKLIVRPRGKMAWLVNNQGARVCRRVPMVRAYFIKSAKCEGPISNSAGGPRNPVWQTTWLLTIRKARMPARLFFNLTYGADGTGAWRPRFPVATLSRGRQCAARCRWGFCGATKVRIDLQDAIRPAKAAGGLALWPRFSCLSAVAD